MWTESERNAMSELVNRIHSLKQKVSELQGEVAAERARYVDEVDHSDEMAYILRSLRESVDGQLKQDIDYLLRVNSSRRHADESLSALSYSHDD